MYLLFVIKLNGIFKRMRQLYMNNMMNFLYFDPVYTTITDMQIVKVVGYYIYSCTKTFISKQSCYL